MRRCTDIIEQVPQVLPALAAQELNPVPAIGVEGLMVHMLPYLRPKARKAGAHVKLLAGLKQSMAAAGTGVNTPLLLLRERICFLFPDQDFITNYELRITPLKYSSLSCF